MITLRAPKTLRLGLLLAAAATGLSQSESEPYFALSTTRSFPSHGKPSVALSAWNIDSLEFRVYRIADPVQFFEQLEDAHQFGGRAPAPARSRTLLEKIHLWKRGVRAGIRRSLRAQFSESPSSHFESLLPRRSATVSKGTHYAAAPVLNSQQLVLSFVQPVRSHARWERATVDLGIQEKGIYLVEAVRGELRAYTILMVSDIAMITKTGTGRVVNVLVDRVSGQPRPAARIAVLARDRRLSEAVTDSDGVADIPLAVANAGDIRVVARSGDDFAINTLAAYAFGANAEQLMGYIYTDRPVYRPGHTVHFRAVLRLATAGGYRTPPGRPVSVAINDPDQKPIYQKTLSTNANGTIHDELTLPPSAALGFYFIEAKSGESSANGNFEVQEYKKPEYEVRVTTSRPRVLEGERAQATIDARYYFGEPVSGARVKYSIYRGRYWFPLWYDPDEDAEASQSGDDQGDSGDQLNETEGRLDADGKLTIDVPTSISDLKHDYVYRIEARVTDQANREITGKAWLVAAYGSFAVNATPDRYIYTPGSKATFQVQARNYENQPVATHARLELLTWDYREKDKSEVKAAADVDIGASGPATASLDIPRQGGSYRVRITARTPEGRDVEGLSYLWVSGGDWGGFGRESRTVQIVADKKNYRAGDTAKLLIVTGQANTPVLVSVEGRDLKQYKLVRSAEATASFELPVTADDEPGITVNASFVRQGNFYNGSKYVKVPPVEHQLNVQLATDRPQYLPGQSADYSITVTGADGRPVRSAELSLGVVDEAIYGVRRDTTQDILSFFFGREWNRVFTQSSLDYYFTGEAGKRRMRLAELRPASRLAQLKPERLVQPKVRKAFPDTAFWAADLTTDHTGRAHAKVDFPDSLTTWRATARGVTAGTLVGSATLKTVVRKNLILRLAVPRFFVQGDEVTISALVHNYLPNDKTARVSLDVAGLEVLAGSTRDVRVPSRGETKVDWRVRAKQVRSATVTGKALTDEESDALELTLPVNVPGVRMAQARGGGISAGAGTDFDLSFPQKVQPGSRSLSIRISPSIAGSLFAALDYLTSYPYGCVEQTMSSFLPDIVVAQTLRDIGAAAKVNAPELQEKIRAGLERLYNFQHEDGGWGWWETDESHPFMTAYVVAGLVQAQTAGTQVRPQAVEKGVAWLQRRLAQDRRLAADLQAYMVYALTVAGHADPAALGGVYQKERDLSPYGLALLGLALEQAKDPRAVEISAALERAAVQDSVQAWWTATRDQMLDFSEDATPEATAYAMKFLSHQHPDSALLPKAAGWLMDHRNEGYWWSSTKQTAMVIYGLIDYLKAGHELNPNLTATVLVNGRQVLTQKFEQAGAVNPPELVLNESQIQAGVNHIRIVTSGTGRLYYSTRAEYFSSDERLEQTGSVSLNVLRDYFRLVPARESGRIVYETAPFSGPAAVGDLLAVRLTVTGSEWRYVMLEDPIPAGTEFIERDNVYELKNRPPWWEYIFTRRELHDDRLAIFQTYFPRGQQQYFYLLKVVNPGVFQVSPARVGPMYQPSVMATSESRRLEVK